MHMLYLPIWPKGHACYQAQAESARLQAEIMRQLPGHGLMGMVQI